MGNGCVQHVWFVQKGALIVHLARVMHKCTIITRIFYVLKKTIYGLKKTSHCLKRLFTAQKRLIMAWAYFYRIVSLFLITWCTFNQSMNKNVWMPCIMFSITWQVALWTLGQLVESTGYVIEPYNKYPNLLDVLLQFLTHVLTCVFHWLLGPSMDPRPASVEHWLCTRAMQQVSKSTGCTTPVFWLMFWLVCFIDY